MANITQTEITAIRVLLMEFAQAGKRGELYTYNTPDIDIEVEVTVRERKTDSLRKSAVSWQMSGAVCSTCGGTGRV